MAVTSTKIVRLSFSTSLGKAYTITIPNPKAGLTKEAIQQVMQTLIDSNIVFSSGGTLTGIRDIKIIDTAVEDLYDPSQS